MLFRALLEILSNDSPLDIFGHTTMFAGGSLKKILKCTNSDCQQKPKEISGTTEILEVRDINFFKENEKTFFQSYQEKRTCACNKLQNTFNCKYSATSLPEILVIRIQDTINSKTSVKILEELVLQQSKGLFMGIIVKANFS